MQLLLIFFRIQKESQGLVVSLFTLFDWIVTESAAKAMQPSERILPTPRSLFTLWKFQSMCPDPPSVTCHPSCHHEQGVQVPEEQRMWKIHSGTSQNHCDHYSAQMHCYPPHPPWRPRTDDRRGGQLSGSFGSHWWSSLSGNTTKSALCLLSSALTILLKIINTSPPPILFFPNPSWRIWSPRQNKLSFDHDHPQIFSFCSTFDNRRDYLTKATFTSRSLYTIWVTYKTVYSKRLHLLVARKGWKDSITIVTLSCFHKEHIELSYLLIWIAGLYLHPFWPYCRFRTMKMSRVG